MPDKLLPHIKDDQEYLKGSLVESLKEVRRETGVKIATSYKVVLRREKAGISEYQGVRRDPATGYRMYTGAQIKAIVLYELRREGWEE